MDFQTNDLRRRGCYSAGDDSVRLLKNQEKPKQRSAIVDCFWKSSSKYLKNYLVVVAKFWNWKPWSPPWLLHSLLTQEGEFKWPHGLTLCRLECPKTTKIWSKISIDFFFTCQKNWDCAECWQTKINCCWSLSYPCLTDPCKPLILTKKFRIFYQITNSFGVSSINPFAGDNGTNALVMRPLVLLHCWLRTRRKRPRH